MLKNLKARMKSGWNFGKSGGTAGGQWDPLAKDVLVIQYEMDRSKRYIFNPDSVRTNS